MATDARTPWIDIAKGIGILLVIYGHVARGVVAAGLPMDPGVFAVIDRAIYSFHMPLFFLLSGFVFLGALERKSTRSIVYSRIDAIVWPYLLWSLLSSFIEVMLSAYTNKQTAPSDVLALLWQPRAHFWFLYVLFLASLFVLAWDRLFGRSLPALGALAGLTTLLSLFRPHIPDAWMWHALVINTAWVSIGLLMARLAWSPARQGWGMTIAVLLAAAGLLTFRVAQGDTAPLMLTFLTAAACCLSVCLLSARTRFSTGSAGQLLAWIGQRSMPIYLAHILAASGTLIVLQKLLGIHDPSIHLLLGTLAGLIGPLVLYVLAPRIGLSFLFTPPGKLRLAPRG